MSGNKLSVLVTGGLGNLGSWITDHLINSGKFTVHVLSNSRRAVGQTSKYNLINCDLSDLQELKNAIGQISFDYIIHLASVNDTFVENYAELALRVNALGTRNLLEVIKSQPPKKLIYFSTFHVYGRSSGPVTEEMLPVPKNDYAITHLFAEEYIRMFHGNYQLPYLIFRLSNSYGAPIDPASSKWYLLFNDLCKMAFKEKQIVLKTNGLAVRDFIYMGDVCSVVESALLNNIQNETFNLGASHAYSLLEIAGFVKAAYKAYAQEDLPVIVNESDKTVYAQDLQYCTAKLRNAFSLEPQNAFVKEAQKIFSLLTTNN